MSQDLYFLYKNSKDVEIINNIRKALIQKLKDYGTGHKVGRILTEKHMSKTSSKPLIKTSVTHKVTRSHVKETTSGRDKSLSEEEKLKRSNQSTRSYLKTV
ncbi:unnamed protein product [Schistosoma turkestanicum]|nr:unnamed protein product [Schistosoma turkestanicum]